MNTSVDKLIENIGLLLKQYHEIIYIENVRSFLNIKTSEAKDFCDKAVMLNYLHRKFGVTCPFCKRMVHQFHILEDLPKEITCETCELMERGQYKFNPSKNIITFYRVVKNSPMTVYEKVYSFPTKHKEGFIQSEIDELLKQFYDVRMDKFNDAMCGNTCLVKGDEIIIYHCDVLTAIRCGINNREILPHEFD